MTGQVLLDKGITAVWSADASVVRIPLGSYNVFTEVSKTTYNGEPALLFFVIKMPNGFGKLWTTRTRLVYEPEGGVNLKPFTIDRTTIRTIETQSNWQAVQNFPNINIEYQKDKKQFGINRVKPSSDFAQIDLSLYWTALGYLRSALDDFDGAVKAYDDIINSAKSKVKLEADEKAAAEAAALEAERLKAEKRAQEIRIAKERVTARIRLAEQSSEKRKLYDQEVLLFIENRKSQLRGASPTTRTKVLDAITALRKMGAAAEVGVIFADYSSRLIDTKAAVDEALELMSDNYLKKELALAMTAYVDAGKSWNKLNTANSEILVERDEMFWDLVDQYDLRPDISNPEYPALHKQQLLNSIWAAGAMHLRNAATLASF